MRSRALLFVFVVSLSASVAAQVAVQPVPAPLVTAENEVWFRAGDPIDVNGEIFAPVGAPQAFDGTRMGRGGVYRGIPFYTMSAFEPNSVIFIPLSQGRVQAYARLRPRTGLTVTPGGFVAQAPPPPLIAPPVDLVAPSTPPAPIVVIAPPPAMTARSRAPTVLPPPAPVGTSGRVTVSNAARDNARPAGINGSWIEFSGRRWVASGPAQEMTADLAVIGTHRGFPIYRRGSDTTTIYIVTVPGLVVPYRPR